MLKKCIRILDIALVIFLFFIFNKFYFSFKMESRQATLYALGNTALFTLGVLIFIKKYQAYRQAKVREKKEIEDLRRTLMMLPKKEYFSFLHQVVRADFPDARRLSRGLYISDSALIVLPLQDLRIPAVINAMTHLKANQVIVYSPLNESVCENPYLPVTPRKLTDIHRTMTDKEIPLAIRVLPESPQKKQPLLVQIKTALYRTPPIKNLLYAGFFMFAAFFSRYGLYYMCIALVYGCLALGAYWVKNRPFSQVNPG